MSALDDIADTLHYPECWCTVAYPTIFDAIYEVSIDKINVPLAMCHLAAGLPVDGLLEDMLKLAKSVGCRECKASK